ACRGPRRPGGASPPGWGGVAGGSHPGLTFRAANMSRLPAGAGSLAGIVAFYSMIHLPRPRIPAALAEFRRVLAPGGALLAAMHGGAGVIGSGQALGFPLQGRATPAWPEENAAMAETARLSGRERPERA